MLMPVFPLRLAAAFLLLPASAAHAVCAPLGLDRAGTSAWKAGGFKVDPGNRQAVLDGLVNCLWEPDPALRDGVGYEGLATILRGGQVPPSTLPALEAELRAGLAAPDPLGIRRPFAILALAEVVRADRLSPALSAEGRALLLETGAQYLETLTDYRGFDPHVGWRHGVAHGADLMMQLAMNPAVDRAGLLRILQALGSQVAPAAHSYVQGESDRLARAAVQVARRGVLTAPDWSAWFARLGDPAPLAGWDQAFQSEAGLARRHNLRAFAYAVHATAAQSRDPAVAALGPEAVALLAATD
jgi:hypothetical protein